MLSSANGAYGVDGSAEQRAGGRKQLSDRLVRVLVVLNSHLGSCTYIISEAATKWRIFRTAFGYAGLS